MTRILTTEEFHTTYLPSDEPLTAEDVIEAEATHVWTIVSRDNPTTWMNELIAKPGKHPYEAQFIGYVVTTQPWTDANTEAVYYDPMDPFFH
jgi:hypothetical protein